MAPKADLPVGEATLPWGGRRQGGPPPGARAEVLRMAPLVTASVSAGLPGRAPQRGNFRKGRSSGLDLDPLRDAPHRRRRTDPYAHQSQQHLRRLGPGFARTRRSASARFAHRSTSAARPGEISMSTFGHPGRDTSARTRKRAHWPPYDAGRVPSAGVSAVRLLVGRGATRNLVSRESRDASPRRVARLVDEQQALPAVPAHDADRRSPSTPRRSPATDGRRKTSGAIPASRCNSRIARSSPTKATARARTSGSARVARGPSPRRSATSPWRLPAGSEHATGSRPVTRSHLDNSVDLPSRSCQAKPRSGAHGVS